MSTDLGSQTGASITKDIAKEKGSILLEFTFVATILLVIFLAMVTFSFLFSERYAIQKVAREGAREASITRNEDWAREKALHAAWLWGLDPNKVEVGFYRDDVTETCVVRYTAIPFSKTFPTLVKGSSLQPVNMSAWATFVWAESQ